MNDHTLQNILLNTFTKSDFYRGLGVAREYLERIFYNTDDSDDNVKAEQVVLYAQNSGDGASADLIRGWGGEVFSTFTRDNLYSRLDELKESAEKLPELTLYVPVDLDAEGVTLIGSWCRKNIDTSLLLNIIVDPSAIGGCKFVWNGAYRDFSLGYFLEKKPGIVSNLLHEYGA